VAIQQLITRRDRTFLDIIRGCALGVLLLTPFYGFWSTWLGSSIGPLWLWKSLLDIVVALLGLALIAWLVIHRTISRVLVHQPIVLTMITFAALALIVTEVMPQPTTEMTVGLAFGLRHICMFCIMFGTSWFLGSGHEWRRKVARVILWVTVVLVTLGIIQVTVAPADVLTQFGYGPDTIAPVSIIDDNSAARRAFATMRGPNDFGAFMLVPLAVACVSLLSRRQRIVLALFAAVGLFISGSRSAMIGGIVVVIMAVLLQHGMQLLRSRRAIGMTLAGVIAAGVMLAGAMTIPTLRLIVFHSSPTDSHLTEGSTDQHWQRTMIGIENVIHQPLGCGLGCAGPASFYSDSPSISENYYVQIAEEAGVIGLVLWVTMTVLVMKALYWVSRCDELARSLYLAGIGIAVVGFWLHVWGDITLSLVWWGLAGIMLGETIAKSNKKRYDIT